MKWEVNKYGSTFAVYDGDKKICYVYGAFEDHTEGDAEKIAHLIADSVNAHQSARTQPVHPRVVKSDRMYWKHRYLALTAAPPGERLVESILCACEGAIESLLGDVPHEEAVKQAHAAHRMIQDYFLAAPVEPQAAPREPQGESK